MASARTEPGGGSADWQNQLQAALSEVPMMIHSPPDINSDAEIMGVCGLSEHLTGANKYAWIGVDFLRWKTLFYGVGNRSFQVSEYYPRQ